MPQDSVEEMTVYKVIRYTERPVVGMTVILKRIDTDGDDEEFDLWLGDTLETKGALIHKRGSPK